MSINAGQGRERSSHKGNTFIKTIKNLRKILGNGSMKIKADFIFDLQFGNKSKQITHTA
jgi:hypothetical protein